MTDSTEHPEGPRPGVGYVVHYYTKGRRQMPYVGTDTSGNKIPGGPYTVAQPIAAVVVGALTYASRPLWSGYMPYLIMWTVVVLAAASAGFLAGKIDLTGQNPVFAADGGLKQLTAKRAGRLGGQPIRMKPAHGGGRKLRVLCAVPTRDAQPSYSPEAVSQVAAPVEPQPHALPMSHQPADQPTHHRDGSPAGATRVSGLESLLAAATQTAGEPHSLRSQERNP